MSSNAMFIESVGLYGPGLVSWPSAQGTLRGEVAHVFERTVLPPPARLPAAESRRAGNVIRLAMKVADEAVAHAGIDPRTLGTVFTSSGGEGTTCHSLCESLASANPLVSPIKFTNSVHNAAAGNWHIAVGSRAASTSLSAYDGSFAAGLIEASTLLRSTGEALMLVAYDVPYPEPLHSQRHLIENFGVAFVLTPDATARSLASMQIELAVPSLPADACSDASLEAVRNGIPAAASLPLLQRLAALPAADGSQVLIDYLPQLQLRVTLHAVPRPGS